MKIFKRTMAVVLIAITALLCMAMIQPNYKTEWEIVNELCKNEGYSKIHVVNTNELTADQTWRTINNRKWKSYIVVEKIISESNGDGYGWYKIKGTAREFLIGYNSKIDKGEMVTSYVIWNPETDECDDVLYVVDNAKYR